MLREMVSSSLVIRWGVSSRPLPGESVSGDAYLVRQVGENWLLAVVDGLGHGFQAAAVAAITVGVLNAHADEGLSALVHRCHGALLRTRGVVMTLAWIEPHTHVLTWAGVGNVEGILRQCGNAGRPRVERPLLHSGVVGSNLLEVRPRRVSIGPGDLLVLATDGIEAGFAEGLRLGDAPQTLADSILRKHGRYTDDALVLVVSIGEAQT